MGNASTRNAYSSSQQKVSSHSNGISKIEGLIVSTTPEPKVKQKRIREPDCHKKGGWVAIGTFVVTHPSEKVPILCNTRYDVQCCLEVEHGKPHVDSPFPAFLVDDSVRHNVVSRLTVISESFLIRTLESVKAVV